MQAPADTVAGSVRYGCRLWQTRSQALVDTVAGSGRYGCRLWQTRLQALVDMVAGSGRYGCRAFAVSQGEASSGLHLLWLHLLWLYLSWHYILWQDVAASYETFKRRVALPGAAAYGYWLAYIWLLALALVVAGFSAYGCRRTAACDLDDRARDAPRLRALRAIHIIQNLCICTVLSFHAYVCYVN